MKLITVFICRLAFACILCSMLFACSKENSQAPKNVPIAKETIRVDDLELVEVAIAIYACESSFNPCSLSSRIKNLISKHSNERYQMSYSTVSWRDFEATIHDDGKIEFIFQSDPPTAIQFRKGQIGIRNNEIYVQENTQMKIDGKLYTYRSGKWQIQTESFSKS